LENTSGAKRGHRALFIRIGVDEGLLSPIERDGLWQRHGVPMFEHLVGMDGELLAWECEAHRGLHVVGENAVFEVVHGELLLTSLTDLEQPTLQMRTGWSAQIETGPCDCGRPGARLAGLRELVWLNRSGPKSDGLAIAAHN
jgi:phenylacetate-CoA ligase